MPAMAVRAVIFDIGGVVMRSPIEIFHVYEREQGLPRNFINVSIATRTHVEGGGSFQKMERGLLRMGREFYEAFEAEIRSPETAAAYKAYAAARGEAFDERRPVAVDARELFERMAANGGPYEHMVDVVRLLRQAGLRTAALTNNFEAPVARGADGAQPEAQAALFRLFDAVVESWKCGLRKPDPRIYRLAVQELDRAAAAAPAAPAAAAESQGSAPSWRPLEMQECIFLDDLGMNLRPAKALGMRTVKVTLGREAEAVHELVRILGGPQAGGDGVATLAPEHLARLMQIAAAASAPGQPAHGPPPDGLPPAAAQSRAVGPGARL